MPQVSTRRIWRVLEVSLRSFAEARGVINRWIEHYNEERLIRV